MDHPYLRALPAVLCAGALAAMAACGEPAALQVSSGTGPNPDLPAPSKSLIPTVHVAKATGWPDGTGPTAAAGLQVAPYATNLEHPRWLHVLPNGDVLVAESAAPPKPPPEGLRAKVMAYMMKRAGSVVPSANRITLLRDADGDGKPEVRTVFASGLNSPFGMALVGDRFYVANTDGVVWFPYTSGQTQLSGQGTRLVDLPGGPRNHHWTKSLIASPDGRYLYATVGSNSNVAENGMAEEEGRAAIWQIDLSSGARRLYATGLRNPNGMIFEPQTGMLWTVVNERDELGSDLVPDYMTSVKDGGFYGWPYSYYGNHVDARVQPPRPDLVATALKPDYALGPHTASLGLAYNNGQAQPAFGRGAYIGMHGSWNRKPHSGYKVVWVPFQDGKPAGMPVDMVSGFLSERGEARGRPVGVAFDGRGALLVADDVGNAVWRVTGAATSATAKGG